MEGVKATRTYDFGDLHSKWTDVSILSLSLQGKTLLLLVLSTARSHKIVKIFLNNHFATQTQ